MLRRVVCISLVVVLCAIGLAQEKEANAVATLDHSLQATGWTSSQLPSDAIVDGEFLRVFDGVEQSFPATVKIKGRHRFKMAAESGMTSIVNEKDAVITTSTEKRRLPGYSAYAMRPSVLPMFSELPLASAGTFNIRDRGKGRVNEEPCLKVEIEPALTDKTDPDRLRRRAATIAVWVSEATGLIMQVEYLRPTDSNPSDFLRITDRYSDYRRLGTMMVPYEHEEFVEGRSLYRFKAKNIAFNTGIPDSEFEIPADQEGK